MSQIVYRKSSRSGDETNKAQCVEVGADAGTICLRDSKTVIDGVHQGAVLRVTRAGLAGLITAIKTNELDL